MDLFLGAEDRELVEKLNQVMGTRYRTTPYNFKNPDDFAQALTMVTAEYIDFSYYWGEVGNVIEHLDESVETFYPAQWQKLVLGETTQKDIEHAVNKLHAAHNALDKLMEKAENQCQKIWFSALTSAPDEVLQKVCGEAFRAEPEQLEKLLTFEFKYTDKSIADIWQYNVEKTAWSFGRALKRELDAMQNLG